MGKSVAIIGAGVSGLAAGKAMKEAGLNPHIFEASTLAGGLWCPFSHHLHQSMKTNVSKYTCSFSDFPWPAQTPLFPTAAQVGQYLADYCKTFLADAILLNSRVTNVRFKKTTMKWRVTVQAALAEHTVVEQEHEYDYLIVASGFFAKAFIPKSIHGLDNNFNGKIYHSAEAQILLSEGTLDLESKTVVVIGGSLSGVEISGRLPIFSPTKIYHVTKKPFLVLPKYLPAEPSQKAPAIFPIDLVLFAKIPPPAPNPTLVEYPEKRQSKKIAFLTQFTGNQRLICPRLEIRDKDPLYFTISDNYMEYVRSSRIEVILGELTAMEGSSLKVLQENKTVELKNVDFVIMATGSSVRLPYFDAEMLKSIDYDETDMLQPLLLHMMMLHPNLYQAAFIGMYKGPYFAIMELQARYAAALFSGSLGWPSEEILWKGVAKELEIRHQIPRPQFPHSDYIGLVNTLTNELGSYDRKDMTHLIAAKYNSSSASTSLVRSLELDLEAGKEGKWVAEAVFRNLQGRWQYARQTGSGIAEFVPNIRESECQDIYDYFENIIGSDNDDSRKRIYVFNCTESIIYVCDRNGDRLWSLSFAPDENIGWKATGTYKRKGCLIKLFCIFPFEGIYFSEWEFEVEVIKSDGNVSKICTKYTRESK